MGTRADFYVRNENAEPKMQWLGSIAWDGYSVDDSILKATTEEDFKSALQKFLADRDDATHPETGWPWPWNDSRTTDYSYIFENGKVMASNFGYPLYDPIAEHQDEGEDDDEPKMENYFPDMKNVQNITFGKRSGVIIFQAPR